MGLFGHLRSKLRSKDKDRADVATNDYDNGLPSYDEHYDGPSSKAKGNGVSALVGFKSRKRDDRDHTVHFDGEEVEHILHNIFTYVCPHTVDDRYERIENCDVGDICMLCCLRDLASCAATKRGWYATAMKLL